MMAKMSTPKAKYKFGSVIAIPLPNNKFAFAKIFRDFDLGVYDFVSDKIENLTDIIAHKIAFFQATTSSPIKSGAWPVIGEELFPDEESSWGPPKASGVLPGMEIDPLKTKIMYKGELRCAKPEEIVGMDIESFCQRPELFVQIVVDRLINGNHNNYRVKL